VGHKEINMDSSSTKTIMFRVEVLGNGESLPATMTATYDEHGWEPVRCSLLPNSDERWSHVLKMDEEAGFWLELKGEFYLHHDIYVPCLRLGIPEGRHSGILEGGHPGIAELFIEGDLAELVEPIGSFTCYLTIPHSALLVLDEDFKIPSEADVVSIFRRDEPTGIAWQTPLGTAELTRTYSSFGQPFGVDHARVQIQEHCIKITISDSPHNSVIDLVKSLESTFDSACWLLSFLGKRRLPWYKATIIYEPRSGIEDRRRFITVRRDAQFDLEPASARSSQHPARLLIDRRNLTNGVFNQMMQSFEAQPNKEIILLVLENLLTTYEDFYMEAHYGIIWTALEIMVDGLGQDIAKTLRGSAFDNLRDKLEALLDEALSDKQEILDNIKSKIVELQRVPFKWKLKQLFERDELDPRMFWPAETEDWESELKQMSTRRNQYIHSGHIENYYQNSRDIYRLRFMLSVWILKRLGYPISELNEAEEDWLLARTKKLRLP
jgi:hypothetical protein